MVFFQIQKLLKIQYFIQPFLTKLHIDNKITDAYTSYYVLYENLTINNHIKYLLLNSLYIVKKNFFARKKLP